MNRIQAIMQRDGVTHAIPATVEQMVQVEQSFGGKVESEQLCSPGSHYPAHLFF